MDTEKSLPVVNKTSHTESSGEIDSIVLQSRQLAVQGNQLAQTGDYHGAVDMFTKAINLDQTDFRYVTALFPSHFFLIGCINAFTHFCLHHQILKLCLN